MTQPPGRGPTEWIIPLGSPEPGAPDGGRPRPVSGPGRPRHRPPGSGPIDAGPQQSAEPPQPQYQPEHPPQGQHQYQPEHPPQAQYQAEHRPAQHQPEHPPPPEPAWRPPPADQYPTEVFRAPEPEATSGPPDPAAPDASTGTDAEPTTEHRDERPLWPTGYGGPGTRRQRLEEERRRLEEERRRLRMAETEALVLPPGGLYVPPQYRETSPDAPTMLLPIIEAGPEPALGTSSVMRSSGIMAVGTAVSRVLGLARTTALAWAIGTTLSSNVFTTANTLPNSFFILIGGGVLNAVLVPQIIGASKLPDGGRQFVDRLLTLSITVLLIATAAITALATPLFLLYWPKAPTHDVVALGTAFAFWCLPQIFFYGLYTVFGQVLNARGSFGPYMWAPVVNNVVAIVGILAFVGYAGAGDKGAGWWHGNAITILAGTTTLGVIAQALVLLPVLRRTGFRWRPRWGLRGVGLGSAGRVAGWTFAAVAVGQLAFVVTSKVANTGSQRAALAHAGVQAGRFVYDNAYLLFMLPHSLVAVSLVTAFFTRMSHAAGEGRIEEIRADLSLGLRTTGLATVAATVGFLVLGREAATIVFLGNGRDSVTALYLVTVAMAFGLVPFSAQYLMQRVFYAFEDARTPFLIQAMVAVLWTVGNLLCLAVLPGQWVTVGVGAAMSVSNLAGAGLSLLLLRRRIGSVDGATVLRSHVQFTTAGIAGAAAAWLVVLAVHAYIGTGRVAALAALCLAGPVLLAMYGGLLKAMQSDELDVLTSPLLARMGRSAELRPEGRHAAR